jgi:tetratricopeptide (TPR) repeat protein
VSGAFKKTREKLTKNSQDGPAWIDYGNLLWGSGKPLLAKMAYDRALSLNSLSPGALNNRAVVSLGNDGAEDWFTAEMAQTSFKLALKQDDFFLPAKMNYAALLNYYRLFEKSKPLWDQVLVKLQVAEAHEGLAIALQGMGQPQSAEASFQQARDAGAGKSSFARLYHEAVRFSAKGEDGAEKCLDRLGDIEAKETSGFEETAIKRLQRTCTLWKSEAKSKAQ